ncbi:MAG TPA: hypothetical protein VMT43_08365, partial [Acidimicrobiales bacterium]|nr:hypothetical protein [Acidimicrobiales bacterium]
FTGSSDLYESTGRTPSASINFITAHDGFTLRDLVSYESKHNEANGEGNQDGSDDNRSWNCGAEGETHDVHVLALRRRQQRNLMATLLLSQGVPMLLGGDEIGRTQHGNNNAYAQDNEVSWYDWDHADRDLLEVTRRLSELRRQHPVFRRRKWFQGRPIMGEKADDIEWFTPDGAIMSGGDWGVGYARSIAVYLNGDAIAAPDPRGQRVLDDDFYAVFNAYEEPLDFVLPDGSYANRWVVVLDTAADDLESIFPSDESEHTAGTTVTVGGRSVTLLQARRPDRES